jgi:cysteine-rich repeat protein
MMTFALSGCPGGATEETDTTPGTDTTTGTTSSTSSTTTGSTTDVETADDSSGDSTSSGSSSSSTTSDSTTSGSTTSDSTGPASECGNGVVEDGEDCDELDREDGDGCDVDCTFSLVVEVAPGGEHTCVRLDGGLVRCWGSGELGQLGHADTANIGDDELPSTTSTVMVGATASQLVTGYRHTCVIATDGVRCWGSGQYAQLGLGAIDDIGDDETPSAVGTVELGDVAVQLATSFFHTCALLQTDGAVICWGAGPEGQLGYGNNQNIGDDELPASAGPVDIGGVALQVATGFLHTCAVLEGGTVRCWGTSSDGQLGYGFFGVIGDDELPSSAGPVSLGGPAAQIAVGGYHTCALLEDGAVRCWGRGAQGQLGYGNTNYVGDDELPASVGPVEVGGTVTQLTAGFAHTCALLDTGEVRCWGQALFGGIGSGTLDNVGDDELPSSVAPVDVGGPVVELTSGNDHTCAVLDTGAVRCWGLGAQGRLGYGATENIGDDEPPSAAGDIAVF